MKRRLKNISGYIAATVLCLLTAFPAKSEPIVGEPTATLEDHEMLMGNLMKLTIAVPVENDSMKVEFPMLQEAQAQKRKYVPLLNDTVELLVKHTQSITDNEGRLYRQYNLQIQAFDSGRYELPPFELIVGGTPVKTNQVELSVIPVKAKADDKIDDFTGVSEPFEVNPNPDELEEESSPLLWWLTVAALILLVIIAYLYSHYRKTGRILPHRKPVPIYQQALRKLRKLQEQNLPQKGKTKEYYTRLTNILRTYIYRQFGIKTIEKTTTEILYDIRNNESLAQYEGILKSIFETADFVKFAKVNPSVVENGRCLSDAERFVEASHPAEEQKEKGGDK